MSSAFNQGYMAPVSNQAACPKLATTYDAHDPELLFGVLPYVDYLEITPDSIARRNNGRTELHPEILADLKAVQHEVSLIVHGVGLSIGSWEGYDEAYLSLLDELITHIPLKWHSEHLGYLKAGGENLNTMLAMPRTTEALNLLIPRIRALQERYKLPFLLENIVHLLPDHPAHYTDAAFLNTLTAETGCGLILDIYNLECDSCNYGFDIPGFFDELNFDAVREIHIAGGVVHKGYMLDVHSGQVATSTLELTQLALGKAANVEAITFEILPQAVKIHGQQMVTDELARLNQYFKTGKNGYQDAPNQNTRFIENVRAFAGAG